MHGTRAKAIAGLIIAAASTLLSVRPLSANPAGDSLLAQAGRILGPLPTAMTSGKNPITPEKVLLGKTLFYETRISGDGTVSCARCHPMGLYAADGLEKSIGNACKVNPRNAPTLLNAAGQISAHWIGNRKDVEAQARQAVTGGASFGMPTYASVEKVLKGMPGYVALFKRAFPNDKEPVTIDNFARAIGAFERTLVTPSRFDAFLAGDSTALADQEKRGLETFLAMGCAGCHTGPFVGGQLYQKFGVAGPYWTYTKSKDVDVGRYAVTNSEEDRYVFKVPVLRNVEKTPPYFHDGSVRRLDDAARIMGAVQLGKDLSKPEIENIVAFLASLTGDIPDDALRIPILPSLVSPAAPPVAAAPVSPPGESGAAMTSVDRIIVEKSKRRMALLRRNKEIAAYRIALGGNPVGPKTMQGDNRTPEGLYFVDYKVPNSDYHRALHLTYPNLDDMKRADSLGVSAGNNIMIHGLGKKQLWMGDTQYLFNWTNGCIAVTNEEIEEIWDLVPPWTPVEIKP